MSVELKTEHGTFTGETVKECEKLAKKAAREAEKRREAVEEKKYLAKLRAKAVGFQLLQGKAIGNPIPRWAWKADYKPDSVMLARAGVGTACEDELTITTADGAGNGLVFRGKYRGRLINGLGFVSAIGLEETDGEIGLHAVGTNEGEAEFAYVPGFRPADFARE